MKSISGSTKTREPKEVAKEAAEECWLKRMTVIWGDKASHERIARLCLVPKEPVNGVGAVKIVILGVSRSLELPWLKIGFLERGNLWVA